MAYFPDLDGGNLAPHWDIERSLLPNSPTILINLKTGTLYSEFHAIYHIKLIGKLVPHFAELDTSFPVRMTLLILF